MPAVINKDVIRKYDIPGPRYTSYPTAPVWTADVTASVYAQKLKSFGSSQKTLSLYVHIPFCVSLCRFCACNVVIRPTDAKYADEYLDYLEKEIQLVVQNIGKRALIRQLHLGGGTPTFLTVSQLNRLYAIITRYFVIDQDAEIAVEVDPRTIDEEKIKALKALGFNRLSMGVQDFDERVQKEVNRVQSFEQVARLTQWGRDLQFKSINFDLIYGLPHQTLESFSKTLDETVQLRPDRVALYSFAYVPWLKKHQNLIAKEQLPVNDLKLDIFLKARSRFLESGYQAIAMDHFALKTDELSKAYDRDELYRNFMGYTVKPADEYIGVGLTSIGFLEKTFIQNDKVLKNYYQALDEGRLPVERGKVLSVDDQIRQWAINELMCHFKINKKDFYQKFAKDFDEYFAAEQAHIAHCAQEGLLEAREALISVTELGKIFIRNVCMGFDWYLAQRDSHKRFSQTV